MSEIKDHLKTVERAQWRVVALVVACTVGAILYRLLMHRHLGHSAAMFLGLPAVLAILLALTPKAETVTGGIFKGITLFLLIIAPLLGEGFLCILMASPLFYLVGLFVGIAIDWNRKRLKGTLSCMTVLLLPMCLEGVIPQLTVDRNQTVAVTRAVHASPDAVEASLCLSPRVDTAIPKYLRVSFPTPLEAHGEGLSIGAIRAIRFTGAEGHPPGDLLMRVAERRRGYLRFDAISDDSKIADWVKWDYAEVAWKEIDATHTAVTWTLHFERQLDPAWYFVPWERAAVHEAAKYLIEANATPAGTVR
jgi:hypothetical protein